MYTYILSHENNFVDQTFNMKILIYSGTGNINAC